MVLLSCFREWASLIAKTTLRKRNESVFSEPIRAIYNRVTGVALSGNTSIYRYSEEKRKNMKTRW